MIIKGNNSVTLLAIMTILLFFSFMFAGHAHAANLLSDYPEDPVVAENDAATIAKVENDFTDEFKNTCYAGKIKTVERKVAVVAGYHFYVANIALTQSGFDKLSKMDSNSMISFMFKQNEKRDDLGYEWNYSVSGLNSNDLAVEISWGKNVNESDNSTTNTEPVKQNTPAIPFKETVYEYMRDGVRDSFDVAIAWSQTKMPREVRTNSDDKPTSNMRIDENGKIQERVSG